MKPAPIMWLDSHFISTNDAQISALSQTFHYGFGVYEGIRSYETADGPAIFRLNDHTERLFSSAKRLDIKVPYSEKMLNEIHHETLKRNKLANAYLRPVIFMGDEYLGLHTQKTSVHVMLIVIPWNDFYMGKAQKESGIAIKTSEYKKLSLAKDLHKAKANGLYLVSMMANNEAQAAGFQEALLLDKDGYVAEGSGANIFMVKEGVLYTPTLSYILDGITRRTIITLAKDNGITVVEKNISLEELYMADEVFFTGTAAEILPITQVDDHAIGSSQVGPITQMMQLLYLRITTGNEPLYDAWLSKNREYDSESSGNNNRCANRNTCDI